MTLTNKELEEIILARNQAERIFAEAVGRFRSQWEQIATEMQKAREIYAQNAKAVQEGFKAFIEHQKQLPVFVRRFLARLAEHGWFLHRDIPMSEMISLARLASEDSVEELDKRLSKHFKSRFKDLFDDLVTRNPERKNLLKVALRAHKRGEFSLSIPIFLIQADGICNEFFGVQLFRKRNRVPATADVVDKLELDPFVLAFLEPLRLVLPINEDTKHVRPGQFNRHAIIHGLTSSYGTEVNSLKAFSLLIYVSDQVNAVRSKHPHGANA